MYRKNLVFFAACFGMLLFGIVFLSLGSMVSMLTKRLALGDIQLGNLATLLSGGLLAGSLIFGPLVDRFGYKWLLILCSLMVMIALESIVFATSIGPVMFHYFLIGFGGGMLNGATNALVADISEGERGAKLSLLGVFFGMGALGMPGLLASLSQHFSSESIVAGIGFFIVLPVIYFLVIQFPPPKAQSGASLLEGFKLLRDPILLLTAIVLGFQSGMEAISNDWITRYFSKIIYVSEDKSLYALTTLVGSLTGARLVLGGLLKKIPSHHVLLCSFGFIAAGAAILMSAANYQAANAGVICIGFGLAACFPVLLGYIGDLYPTKSGTAFSITFFIAVSGNMIISKMMGHIAASHGVSQFPKVLLACLVCALVLLALVVSKLQKIKPELFKNNEQSRETMVG